MAAAVPRKLTTVVNGASCPEDTAKPPQKATAGGGDSCYMSTTSKATLQHAAGFAMSP